MNGCSEELTGGIAHGGFWEVVLKRRVKSCSQAARHQRSEGYSSDQSFPLGTLKGHTEHHKKHPIQQQHMCGPDEDGGNRTLAMTWPDTT